MSGKVAADNEIVVSDPIIVSGTSVIQATSCESVAGGRYFWLHVPARYYYKLPLAGSTDLPTLHLSR